MVTTPTTVIKLALSESERNGKGEVPNLVLEPGLSVQDLAAFEAQLPGPLPLPARELLAFCSGFHFEPLGFIDLVGEVNAALEEILPCGRTILVDGSGNQWVIDIHPGSGLWGAIFYVCHDPPVLVVQASNLAQFLDQVFDLRRQSRRGAIEWVRREVVPGIWAVDSLSKPAESLREVVDSQLATFARELPDGWMIADLRNLEPGQGFVWGRNGPATLLRRSDSHLLFAAGPPRSRARWLGFFRRK
jgi:hypothetical protein